eukprot:TRINITY_DN4147_c0_g3_i2.p2 TRINITY_DN4147_c0_g3~~TRINITY_DN4147_c0_g3_i2.p2  ORF type:complete len:178 (-),score=39.00 TRINITY_DN4147_c0_g3_i2:281-814(-)
MKLVLEMDMQKSAEMSQREGETGRMCVETLQVNSGGKERECGRVLSWDGCGKRARRHKNDIESLKRDIKLRSEHLIILQKQMVDCVLEATLLECEDFIIREEKASHDELLELIDKLRDKQQSHKNGGAMENSMSQLSNSHVSNHNESKENYSHSLICKSRQGICLNEGSVRAGKEQG